VLLDQAGCHPRVCPNGARSISEARSLQMPRGEHAITDHGGGFAGIASGQILIFHGRHFHVDIDSVQERAANTLPVFFNLRRRAAAIPFPVSEKTAGASLRCLFPLTGNQC